MTSEYPLIATDRLMASPLVQSVSHEGDTVLLNAITGRYFGLNEVGTEVWDGVLDGKALGDIANAISDRYAAPIAQVTADVLRVATALTKHELAQRCV